MGCHRQEAPSNSPSESSNADLEDLFAGEWTYPAALSARKTIHSLTRRISNLPTGDERESMASAEPRMGYSWHHHETCLLSRDSAAAQPVQIPARRSKSTCKRLDSLCRKTRRRKKIGLHAAIKKGFEDRKPGEPYRPPKRATNSATVQIAETYVGLGSRTLVRLGGPQRRTNLI
jgi:hypothetical protein